ncbi:DUF1566 domain-containing protein, partial [Comamonadaceae bacterium OH3737_COT-264]
LQIPETRCTAPTDVQPDGSGFKQSCTLSGQPGQRPARVRTDEQANGGTLIDGVYTVTAESLTPPPPPPPPPPPFVPKLPHTGTTDQQCYEAGSDALVACDSPEAIALSGAEKQDGMRRHINPMSYSAVPKPGGGHYDKTECVKDENTGLIWEGKLNQSGHLRHYENRYTNLDNHQPGDASAYVAAVNAQGLCGFNDWRLPTVRELQGLVDYSKPHPSPTIDTNWFPHTRADDYAYWWGGYWTSEPYAGNPAYAWYVHFGYGYVYGYHRGDVDGAVRLVRASQ